MRAYYQKGFKKSYKRLPEKLKIQANERIALFLEDPYNSLLNNHLLSGKYKGFRSINITGNYRAIYQLETQDLVYFVEIDTHSNLYK